MHDFTTGRSPIPPRVSLRPCRPEDVRSCNSPAEPAADGSSAANGLTFVTLSKEFLRLAYGEGEGVFVGAWHDSAGNPTGEPARLLGVSGRYAPDRGSGVVAVGIRRHGDARANRGNRLLHFPLVQSATGFFLLVRSQGMGPRAGRAGSAVRRLRDLAASSTAKRSPATAGTASASARGRKVPGDLRRCGRGNFSDHSRRSSAQHQPRAGANARLRFSRTTAG